VTANPWDAGQWLTPPVSAEVLGTDLVVECVPGSDFWQRTFYGFERDSGHALLAPFQRGQSCEVAFIADFEHQYDQAGLLLRRSPTSWIKTGVELSDGRPQLGAVVTDGYSDWSCGEVAEWDGQEVTMRASWIDDAVLVRARTSSEPWRTVRLAPFAGTGPALVGPYCASPDRAGLLVRFTRLAIGVADTQLHLD
jgi:regulation of enolase protein 1 (concanavalin A-like superfamily)